jgi:hypothetical protein
VQYFHKTGLGVAFAPETVPMPSLLWPQMAYQQFAMSGFTPYQYVYMSNIYLSSQPLSNIVHSIFTRAVERSGERHHLLPAAPDGGRCRRRGWC